MCGRFTVRTAPHVKLPGVRVYDMPFAARYNIAPTQDVLVVADLGSGLELSTVVWGLIPARSNDGRRFINARSETIETKPSFSDSYRKRRCLIMADGFFEWTQTKSKQPHFFQLRDQSPFAFAGIWDSWGTQNRTAACAIITTNANEAMQVIHHRMPVILRPEDYQLWLDPRSNPTFLRTLLAPLPAAEITFHPVSRSVNSAQNEGPELIDREDWELGTTRSLF